MIDEPTKLKLVENILQSADFSQSKRYYDLLRYLYDATVNGAHLKETTIGIDLFDKDSTFDPHSDPTIRIYISNLRKKLEHYYLTDGKNEKVRIVIPKGHYHLEFIPRNAKIRRPHFSPQSKLSVLVFTPLTICLLIIIGFLLSKRNSPNILNSAVFTNNPIWAEFFQKTDVPTLFVLGDYYFLSKTGEKSNVDQIVRNYNINSHKDLEEFISRDPNMKGHYSELDFTFLRPSTTWGLAEIFPVILQTPNKYYLKLASEIDWEDLSRNNIIFIGTFKTLHFFTETVSLFNFTFTIDPPQISLLNEARETIKTFNNYWAPSGDLQIDHAMIIKTYGPNNNILIMIMGFDETSVIEGAKALTDPSLISQIAEKYPDQILDKPLFFELLLRVEGIKRYRSGLKKEMVFFQKLAPASMHYKTEEK